MSMESFTHSFVQDSENDSRPASSTRPFDDDGYSRFDSSFSNFNDNDSVKDSVDGSVPIFGGDAVPDTPSPTSFYGTTFSPDRNGSGGGGGVFDDGFVQSDGPVLRPPMEMEPEEGFALRDWRRGNAIHLAEKEKREKELLSQIIDEAIEFKNEFYRKRIVAVDNNKSTNREKEEQYLVNQTKFHAEADKNYWKAIADLVPNEVAAINKRKGKKEQEKKPSIVVVQGPKPGKPTDLSRLRHILVRLKHNPPRHMKTAPPPLAPLPTPAKDANTGSAASAPPKAGVVSTATEAVAAA